jgi:hypothetical protein
MAKKALGWVVVLFLVFFVVSNPGGAANLTKQLGTLVVAVGKGFGDFFTRLTA